MGDGWIPLINTVIVVMNDYSTSGAYKILKDFSSRSFGETFGNNLRSTTDTSDRTERTDKTHRTDRTHRKDRRDETIKLYIPGNLRRATFAILAMFCYVMHIYSPIYFCCCPLSPRQDVRDATETGHY